MAKRADSLAGVKCPSSGIDKGYFVWLCKSGA
jgi:hypothetical protein